MNTDSNDSAARQQLIESAVMRLDQGRATEAKAWIEALLARVPTEMVQSKLSSTLTNMIKLVLSAVDQASASNASAFEISLDDGLIVSVIPDRPFVVNTILECCRSCELSPRAVLHPVILVAGKPFALTVVWASTQSSTELKAVESMLKLSLRELSLATDAYGEMKSLLRAAPVQGETRAFIDWLTNEGFNIFGVASGDAKLGLLGPQSAHGTDLLLEFSSHSAASIKTPNLPVECFSSRFESPLHRFKLLTNIIVSGINGEKIFVTGLFTSRALGQECQSIPLLRERFAQIVKNERIASNTHDTKSVANIIDSLPKEEAFSLSVEQLNAIVSSVIDIGTSKETAVTVWQNEVARLVSVAAYQLGEVYQTNTRHEFFDHLEKRFGSVPFIDEMHIDIANRPMVRLYARVAVAEGSLNLSSLQGELEALARSWHSDLEVELRRQGNSAAEEIVARYYSAFSSEYQSLQSAQDCVQDIEAIESLSSDNPVAITLSNFEPSEPHKATIVIYSASREMTISKCVPALESFGFEVVNERSWRITPIGRERVISTRFRVRTRSRIAIDPDNFKNNVGVVCARALNGKTDIDPLNSLHTEVALPYRAVSTLRAYCRLLWQTSRLISRIAVSRAISEHPQLAAKLWQLFDLKFNPEYAHSTAERLHSFAAESQILIESLRDVTDINADRTFRQMRALIENTVRTSLYRGDDTIALKLDSPKIDFLPQPRPFFEIFISSPIVEGCHLRAGPVARGGIRWSDRPDDYRIEVLGLMKTQRVKNSLIVPTGAKGGFVVKNLPSEPKLVPEAVLRAYKEYIRALLSITDNRVQDTIVRPDGVLVYDSPDPYFVVAADKGTAAFSDTANKIAVDEFNFWLGDAFASGGSNGYDHKLYAITAAGAWECVKRHFRDSGTNVDAAPFTAVGIGDMAGDVFGNGLILSSNYKLVAAFNHKHIFLDPSPTPAVSFEERKRLFELKGSQWSDYNPALISKGGGVFSRFEKELRLSPEAKAILGLPANSPNAMAGDDVINAILKAPVDVLWNGGIGTYVRASYQANSDAGDSANDSVRVSATELRSRIIGEGGNLGFTQAARIEFNRLGGKLNTDAIDNSGGVDLSDHEVNLKILFSDLVRSGALTIDNRNKLLKQMAGEVCELVLDHNRSQAVFLSLAERRSARNMPYLARLLRDLTKFGYVNRALDNLPEEDAIRERERAGKGFTRPELAVCLSTTKMWVKDILLDSDILETDLTDDFCLEYFPTAIVAQFRDHALKHPLRKNIVATQIANTLVDTLGVTSLMKLAARAGKSFSEAVRAAVHAEFVLNTRATRTALLRNEVSLSKPSGLSGDEFLDACQTLATTLGKLTAWFLARHNNFSNDATKGGVSRAALSKLHDDCLVAFSGKTSVLPANLAEGLTTRMNELIAKGVAKRDAQLLAWCPEVVSLIEILWIFGQVSGKTAEQAATVYFSLLQSTGCEMLMDALSNHSTADRWEAELLPGLASDLRYALAAGTVKALQNGISELDGADSISKSIAEALRSPVRASMLALFARQVAGILNR